MTVEDIEAKIASISTADNEVAHMREDDLHIAVLRAIAGGVRNAEELAAAALKTQDLDYSRWYA